jgi:hypothetical protein
MDCARVRNEKRHHGKLILEKGINREITWQWHGQSPVCLKNAVVVADAP